MISRPSMTGSEGAIAKVFAQPGACLGRMAMMTCMAVMLGACDGGPSADPREDEVRRAVGQVKSLIDSTATNPMASISFFAMAEQGGTITNFIAASLPDQPSFTCFHEGPKPKAWCVWLRRGSAPNEYLIEGYGAALDKPLIQERATASFARRR